MDQELLERIDLIERMVMDGRRSTQYWGWCLALWGTGQLAAVGWQWYGGNPALVWGVTMSICGVLTGIGVVRARSGQRTETLLSRAVWSVWCSFGISITLLAFLGNFAQIFTPRAFEAVFFALMGLTYVATGLILRWKMQIVVGLLWWASSIFAIFGPARLLGWLFIIMVFLAEVVLGVYLMAKEKADLRHARTA
jgi:hypothetical protein